jgi:ABC-type xylose transport system permease subunit
MLYVLFTLGGMLVSKLFVLLITPTSSYADPFSGLFPGMHSPLMGWALSLIQLAVNTFPALLAFILVRKHLSGTEKRYTARMARTIFAAFLILYFAVSNFSYDILNFITEYILKLLLIPFIDYWLPVMLVAVICIFILGVFYLGLAGATIFPFLSKPEEQAETTPLTDEP